MRGSPLLRAALTFLVILGLAPLLWQMTRPDAVVAPPHSEVTPLGKVTLELAFTTAPKHVTIQYAGQVVWTKDQPDAREDCELMLPWPKQGGELVFQVDWPPDAPLSAMRARLTNPDNIEYERSLWGRGHAETALAFP
jgi:hypothetical protein